MTHTNTEQQDALQLASEMLAHIDGGTVIVPHYLVRQSAHELRRLHARVQELEFARDIARACTHNINMAAQAQRAPLTDALAEYDKVRDHVAEQVGCFDGGCLVKRPKGMHTNGGCKCSRDNIAAQRMMYAGQRLAEAVRGITQEAQG